MKESEDLQNAEQDEVLQRALIALKSEPEPEGPSARVLADTLEVLHRASQEKPTHIGLAQRIRAMSLLRKMTAAALLAISGAAFWLVFSLLSATPSISYAQVADHIRQAHTMVWTEVPGLPGEDACGFMIKMYFLSPGRERMEESSPAVAGGKPYLVVVTDLNVGRDLYFNSYDMMAINQPWTEGEAGDYVGRFLKLADGHGEPIGDRQIGDIKAKGFKVMENKEAISLWVNPKTGLPMQVEEPSELSGGPGNMLFDIQVDPPLDESLFSLDPPSGYRVLTIPQTLEAAVSGLLRIYTSRSQGQFPPLLDDKADFGRFFGTDEEQLAQDMTYQQLMIDTDMANAILRGPLNLKKGVDYEYTPTGAKLGDSSRIVFWYHFPKALGGKFYAVYGDLHSAEVKAKDVGR